MSNSPRNPLAETQTEQRPKTASKLVSLKTELIKVIDAAPSRKAVVERSADDCAQDGDRGEELAAEAERTTRERRSPSQLEKLRRAFWLHRRDLQRWEHGREVRTRSRRSTGELVAFWHPPMPMPNFEHIAQSHTIGIYLSVGSVSSFFDEYKKEIRKDIKAGRLEASMVSRFLQPRPRLPVVRPRPQLTPVRVCALQLPPTNIKLPPREEWPEPKE